MSTQPILGLGNTQQRQTNNVSNVSLMETIRKVGGVAGAIFFVMGAIAVDPLFLLPAALCIVLALDCDLFLSLISSVGRATSSRSGGIHHHHYIPTPTVPLYTVPAAAPSYRVAAAEPHPPRDVAPPPRLHVRRGQGSTDDFVVRDASRVTAPTVTLPHPRGAAPQPTVNVRRGQGSTDDYVVR